MLSTIPTLPLILIVLVGVCLSLAIFVYLYIKIRPKFPVRVNCWFCNKNTDVPYGNRNCWDCPNCEQYNGFGLDGGYNKLIPAQHDELLNYPVAGSASFTKKSSPQFVKNLLCRKCNINQELKIQQLASFTPRDPSCFDEEVEEYRQYLERAYQLCESCELVLQQTLYHQQSLLLDEHRKRTRSGSSQSISLVKAWWQQGLPSCWLQKAHFACMGVASFVFLAYHHASSKQMEQFLSPDIVYMLEITPKYEPLATCMTTCLLIITTVCCHNRARIDVFSAALWAVLFGHSLLVSSPTFKEKINEDDLHLGHAVVLVLAFVTNSLAAFVPRHQYVAKRLMQKGQADMRKRHVVNISSGLNVNNFESSETLASCEQPVINKSPSPTPEMKSTCGISNHTLQHVTSMESPIKSSLAERDLNLSNSDSTVPGELECSLEKLSLGSPGKNRDSIARRSKVCGSQEDLTVFRESSLIKCNGHVRPRRSSVLRPPKFNMRRNITQSSWVAGGYWQDLCGSAKSLQSGSTLFEGSIPCFSPLSRSSSQSSGFHSQSSQSPVSIPNSCNGSLCGGELDHASNMSEPTLPYTSANYPMFRPHCVGIPYYGYPVYMYPVAMSAPPNAINPQSPSLVMNPCFVSQKPYLPGPVFGSPYLPSPIKDVPTYSPVPAYSPVPSDVLSQSGSSHHSDSRMSSGGSVKRNVSTGWLILKQNTFLSVLFIGSLVFNMLAVSILLYRNFDVFH